MLRRNLAFLGHTVFKRLMAAVLVLAVYAWFDNYCEHWLHEKLDISDGTRSLMGAVLSVLLVLRTNSAYDRWWEGRKLWGQLINDCRNLLMKLDQMVQAPLAEKLAAARLVQLYPVALTRHLRGQPCPEVPSEALHPPLWVASQLFAKVQAWRAAGQVDGHCQQLLDRHLSALMDLCGGCERIRNTPLPLSHRALVPQLLFVYLLILPVNMPGTLGSMITICLVGYFLLGLEFIAEELEEPFGLESDDLPLDSFCKTIERSARYVFTDLDKKIDPQGGDPESQE